MKILVLNSGSSSLKYQVIDMETEEMLVKGYYERIGQGNSFLTHKVNGEKPLSFHTKIDLLFFIYNFSILFKKNYFVLELL